MDIKNRELLDYEDTFISLLKKEGKSLNTVKNYQTDLNCFNTYLTKENKNMDLSRLSLEEVKYYSFYLQNKYSSDNSIRRRIQTLRIFFDYLLKEEVVSNNPVRSIPTNPKFLDIPKPTPLQDLQVLWKDILRVDSSDSEINRLIKIRNQIIILLIYGSGLKVSDLASLTTSQILTGKKSSRVLIYHPKRDPYSIPLPDIFRTIYSEYTLMLEVIKNKSQIEFDELLFSANPYRILKGGLSPRGLELIFKDYSSRLKITLTPKSLRQAAIFKWLNLGVTKSQVKEWLGVAPSYSLNLYSTHAHNFKYNEDLLVQIYSQIKKRN